MADLEWVTDQLGRKPSREEWTSAGYPHVGGRHVGTAPSCLSCGSFPASTSRTDALCAACGHAVDEHGATVSDAYVHECQCDEMAR